MPTGSLTTAHRLLAQAVDELSAVAVSGADDELVSLLTVCEGAARRLDRVTVDAVAALERRGMFAEHGYKSTAGALRDLLGWERFEARRRVTAAEHVSTRVGLDGSRAAGAAARHRRGLRATDGRACDTSTSSPACSTPAAARLTPEQWAGAEEQIAAKTADYTPSELHTWGTALVEALDQDGAEPDDRPPAQVNELFLTRTATGGGKLKGRFDDAAMFDAIAAVIDAKAKPLTGDDDRSAGQRQAEALADVCGYVLDHGDVPGVRRAPAARERAGPAGGPGEPGPRRVPRLRWHAVARVAADAVLRRGGGADRPGRRRSAPRRGPGDPDDPGRAAPRRRRPGSRLCASGVRPAAVVVRVPPHRAVGVRRRDEASPIWPCCAVSTTGRSTPRSGSAGSATGCRSSSRRHGSTHRGRRDEKRCRISRGRGDSHITWGIRTSPRRRRVSAPGWCAPSSCRAGPWPPPRRSAGG